MYIYTPWTFISFVYIVLGDNQSLTFNYGIARSLLPFSQGKGESKIWSSLLVPTLLPMYHGLEVLQFFQWKVDNRAPLHLTIPRGWAKYHDTHLHQIIITKWLWRESSSSGGCWRDILEVVIFVERCRYKTKSSAIV